MAVCVLVVLLLRLSIGLVEAQRGQSVTSLLGEDVTFSCSPDPTHFFPSMLTDVDCRTMYSIHWRKTAGVVTDICICLDVYGNNNYNEDKVRIDYEDNTYNLHILNVQPSDTGQYECSTSDYIASPESALTVQLNIFKPSCSTNPQGIKVGEYVSLVCSLDIERALQWIAPNGTVVASRSGESNEPLMFDLTAREEHNFQTFICVAISESGTYNPECEVIPLEYTFITISPQVSRVKHGNNASFICNARLSVRAPHRYYYTWLQDDTIVLQGLNMSSYIVHDLQLSDNGARVQCQVSNGGGEEMGSIEAIIYVSATMTTPNPDDASRTRNDGDSLTSTRSGYIPGPPDTREGSTNNVGLIAGCVGGTVLLLIISVILVMFIKKNKTRKSTGEAEAATTLTRDHDSTSGASKGRDPSKASTPSVANQSSSQTNENDTVYALPQQKGGGHTTAASDSGEHSTAGQSGIAATTDDVDATYAEPFKKQDDGITYDNVTDSRVLVNDKESQPNVEGLLYAELDVTNSNATDGQIINTTEATLYAAIQQVQ